jgi:hypothetical protein
MHFLLFCVVALVISLEIRAQVKLSCTKWFIQWHSIKGVFYWDLLLKATLLIQFLSSGGMCIFEQVWSIVCFVLSHAPEFTYFVCARTSELSVFWEKDGRDWRVVSRAEVYSEWEKYIGKKLVVGVYHRTAHHWTCTYHRTLSNIVLIP